MEDSGHGLDIGSLAAMDESRAASTSDEEEGIEVERASRGVERRRPRRSRVAYKVSRGSSLISYTSFFSSNILKKNPLPKLKPKDIKLSMTVTYMLHTR